MEIIRDNQKTPNLTRVERAASFLAGTLLLNYGLRKKNWVGAGTALFGIAFLRRGITGFCYTYRTLGIGAQTAEEGRNVSVPHQTGIRVDEAITINRPREEVYRFWRDLGNIAEAMQYVESVSTSRDGLRSHWNIKGPGGKCMEWDAEIINEVENELLAWRSLESSEIRNAGSVHFRDAAGGRGTEVSIEMQYVPPGRAIGAAIARVFGEEPSQLIRSDLKRLKSRLEARVISANEGQPAGPKHVREEAPPRTDTVAKASEESFPASDSPAFTH